MKSNEIRWSEMFFSFQGEVPAGEPSLFFRTFGCNLNCKAFGADDPTSPNATVEYNKFWNSIDFKEIHTLQDLPIFPYGCDSQYAWDDRFLKFSYVNTVPEICEMMIDILNENAGLNIRNGILVHPITLQAPQIVLTGGETMLWQPQIINILEYFKQTYNYVPNITIETNATQKLSPKLKAKILEIYENSKSRFSFSMSPKLHTVSGHVNAININNIVQYNFIHSWLKFVVRDNEKSWNELNEVVDKIRKAGYTGDIYCMPVGATKEEQSENWIADCAMKCMKLGYKFCGRLHTYVFGNKVGT